MNEFIKQKIVEEAKRIRARIIEGHLFGFPINSDDPDAMLVVAYYIGQADSSKYYVTNIQPEDKGKERRIIS